jgi:hypothetical protein
VLASDESLDAGHLHRGVRPGARVAREDRPEVLSREARREELREALVDELATVREEEGALPLADGARDNRGGNDRFATAGWEDHQDATDAAGDLGADGGNAALLVGPQLQDGGSRW